MDTLWDQLRLQVRGLKDDNPMRKLALRCAAYMEKQHKELDGIHDILPGTPEGMSLRDAVFRDRSRLSDMIAHLRQAAAEYDSKTAVLLGQLEEAKSRGSDWHDAAVRNAEEFTRQNRLVREQREEIATLRSRLENQAGVITRYQQAERAARAEPVGEER